MVLENKPGIGYSGGPARIEAMPQSMFDEIVEKHVGMNVAHPFLKPVA